MELSFCCSHFSLLSDKQFSQQKFSGFVFSITNNGSLHLLHLTNRNRI